MTSKDDAQAAQEKADPEALYSSLRKPDGSPAIVYATVADKRRGERKVKCKIVNIQLGIDTGNDMLGINTYRHKFAYGVEVEMLQVELDHLRSCKYDAPKIVEDKDTGQLKHVGWEKRSTYSIDVMD